MKVDKSLQEYAQKEEKQLIDSQWTPYFHQSAQTLLTPILLESVVATAKNILNPNRIV